jgi:hypothetical protein
MVRFMYTSTERIPLGIKESHTDDIGLGDHLTVARLRMMSLLTRSSNSLRYSGVK